MKARRYIRNGAVLTLLLALSWCVYEIKTAEPLFPELPPSKLNPEYVERCAKEKMTTQYRLPMFEFFGVANSRRSDSNRKPHRSASWSRERESLRGQTFTFENSHCNTFGFVFLWSTSEITDERHIYRTTNKYHLVHEVNGEIIRDPIITVGFIQPATSFNDPSLEYHPKYIPSLGGPYNNTLLRAYSKFNGVREHHPLQAIDRFKPFRHDLDDRPYLITAEGIDPSSIMQCAINKSSPYRVCNILTFSEADNVAFTLLLPYEELDKLLQINHRVLDKLRRWRVETSTPTQTMPK